MCKAELFCCVAPLIVGIPSKGNAMVGCHWLQAHPMSHLDLKVTLNSLVS